MAGLVQTHEGSQASETSTQLSMDAIVDVTVDGQVQRLPLREVINGYATKAKMTQATQEAAELRRQLGQYEQFMDQLNSDPAGTITALQERFHLSTNTRPSNGDSLEDDDPVSEVRKEMANLRAQLENQQAQLATKARTEKISATLARLKSEFGDAFDPDDVLTYATHNNIGNLEIAWKAYQTDHPNLPNGSEDRVGQETASIAGIASGSTPNTPSEPVSALPKPKTIGESVSRAYREQGIEIGDLLS